MRHLQRLFTFILGFAACLATACSGPSASDNTSNVGSQSNWLACERDANCPDELLCECGVCTTPCAARDECSDLHPAATCVASADTAAACGDTPTTSPVCLLPCLVESDCGDVDATSCREGYCLPAASDSSADASVDTTKDVEVVITADNAYGFGYGSPSGLRNYFGGVGAALAVDIFGCGSGPEGPETYTVPAEAAQAGDTLYIVAWADEATTQGVLGQFTRGERTVYTGVGNWSVCATGEAYDSSSSGPDVAEIDRQIVLCNEGNTSPATTSAGWVDAQGNGVGALAVGEANDTGRGPSPTAGNEFPLTCGIDPEARWMWFNWDPANISWPSQSPFIWPSGASSGSNPLKQFLIFRLAAEETTLI